MKLKTKNDVLCSHRITIAELFAFRGAIIGVD